MKLVNICLLTMKKCKTYWKDYFHLLSIKGSSRVLLVFTRYVLHLLLPPLRWSGLIITTHLDSQTDNGWLRILNTVILNPYWLSLSPWFFGEHQIIIPSNKEKSFSTTSIYKLSIIPIIPDRDDSGTSGHEEGRVTRR